MASFKKTNLPLNDINTSKLLTLLMCSTIWENRNTGFSFQLLHELEIVACTPHLSASPLHRKGPQLVSSLPLRSFVELILVKFLTSLRKAS